MAFRASSRQTFASCCVDTPRVVITFSTTFPRTTATHSPAVKDRATFSSGRQDRPSHSVKFQTLTTNSTHKLYNTLKYLLYCELNNKRVQIIENT